MNISDELLMAYADGELDAEKSAAIDREIANDPGLAVRLERHRVLRTRLRAAFDPILEEPMPEQLTAMLQKPEDEVADLEKFRAAKRAERMSASRSRPWMSMAASIALGIAIGYLASYSNRNAGEALATQSVVSKDGMVVDESLVSALAKGVASQPGQGVVAAKVGITYKSKAGEYCRSFALSRSNHFAGIACHAPESRPEEWRMHMMLSIDAASEVTYRQAATILPPEVLAVVERDMDGETFDAEREAQAVADEWRR